MFQLRLFKFHLLLQRIINLIKPRIKKHKIDTTKTMMVPKNNKNAYTVPTVGSGSSFASMFKPMIKSTTVKVVLNNKDKIKCIYLLYIINNTNTIHIIIALLIYYI